MYSKLIDILQEGKIQYAEKYSIRSKSSIKIDTDVDLCVYPKSVEELTTIVTYLNRIGLKHVVVGGLSNILFRNPIYNGVVINVVKISTKSRADCCCQVSCGCRISSVIRYMAEAGYGGAEALYHIPGTLGGMIKSNAGAFGTEIADLIFDCSILDARTGAVFTASRQSMGFGYRSCLLMNSDSLILLSARLRLVPMDTKEIVEQISRLGKLRRACQPIEPSLGSIFKRVDGVSAGYYIDQCGLKGRQIGGAQISSKHAGFITNIGNAIADDVIALIELAKECVYTKFGVMLEEEIKIID